MGLIVSTVYSLQTIVYATLGLRKYVYNIYNIYFNIYYIYYNV